MSAKLFDLENDREAHPEDGHSDLEPVHAEATGAEAHAAEATDAPLHSEAVEATFAQASSAQASLSQASSVRSSTAQEVEPEEGPVMGSSSFPDSSSSDSKLVSRQPGIKKIMIVDDDLHLVLGLMPRLRAAGYKVISTPDALSAIWVARKEFPDLIILDLGLPGGDGFVVLERMRDLPDISEIPVIVLSARDPSGNKQRALDGHAVAYFQKPPDNRQFLHAVRQAMGEAGTGFSRPAMMD